MLPVLRKALLRRHRVLPLRESDREVHAATADRCGARRACVR
ncbi:MAG: hypothetical protein IPM13_10495 [Phycisphaerales bacterium]|nr:hypothetical protein [Phycisphaerales bacterium]